MRLKTYPLLPSVALIFLLTASWAEASDATGSKLEVKVKRLEVSHGGKRLKWVVDLHNSDKRAIVVSRFSFNSVLLAAKFTDRKQEVWRVARSGVLKDAPPHDVDYSLNIGGTKTIEFSFETGGLEKSKSDQKPLDPETKPKELHYELTRPVAVILVESKKATWFECEGKGNAPLQWSIRGAEN